MTDVLPNKERYAKAVCMFLSEGLRSHTISLERAAEIAQKVVNNLNLVDTEEHFLSLIQELTDDFQELEPLRSAQAAVVIKSKRDEFEQTVVEFAAKALTHSPELAQQVLAKAMFPSATYDSISEEFPVFQQFLKTRK